MLQRFYIALLAITVSITVSSEAGAGGKGGRPSGAQRAKHRAAKQKAKLSDQKHRAKPKSSALQDRMRRWNQRPASLANKAKTQAKQSEKKAALLKQMKSKASAKKLSPREARRAARAQAKAQKRAAKEAKRAAKALAKQKQRAAKESKRNQAKAAAEAKRKAAKADEGADTDGENRIIPEQRKAPIHERLQDPNFFGEKDHAKESVPSLEELAGSADSMKPLLEGSPKFFSGDAGRFYAARLVSRANRSDADFRYSYGKDKFLNFVRAERHLNKIPQGKLAKNLSLDTLREVNTILNVKGGEGPLAKLGQGLRKVFVRGARFKPGALRNYQSMHFAKYGLSEAEIVNIMEHGGRFVRAPWTRKGKRVGFILYRRPKNVERDITALIEKTKQDLKDPSTDITKVAAHFVQKFITIHPFPDGNGRTARLVMSRILTERGIVPPIFANTGADISETEQAFANKIAVGAKRSQRFLRTGSGMSGAAKYIPELMKARGHTVEGIASQKLVERNGLSYGLNSDGFVYDMAGRPHMADSKGNLRPLSQMTHYILARRIAVRKDAPAALQKLTATTREAFAKMNTAKQGEGPKVHSDLGVIKSDGKLAVNLKGFETKVLLDLMDPSKLSTAELFPDVGGRSASPLTTVMSRYQQADLEMWNVKQALKASGNKKGLKALEKHRDVLFERARAELRARSKSKLEGADDLSAAKEFERIQFKHSPLRYATRKKYTKKHGDSEAVVFRGDNFAKWTGVHIDGIPFRPGLKVAAAMRAKKNGASDMFDDLRAVEGDTIGTGVQSYTTDLALLERQNGFADKHKSMPFNLGAMGKLGKALVGLRVKEGETLEVTEKTGILAAVFSRGTVTKPGHISVRGASSEQLETALKTLPEGSPAIERLRAMHKKMEKRGVLARSLGMLRSSRRFQVKLDDVLDDGQLSSLNQKLQRSRNVITATRKGDTLNVTAHRRALILRVKKSAMLPGIHSWGGTFEAEQEVHVVESVLPHRILGTYSRGQLARELKPAKPAAQNTQNTQAAPQADATVPVLGGQAAPLAAAGGDTF